MGFYLFRKTFGMATAQFGFGFSEGSPVAACRVADFKNTGYLKSPLAMGQNLRYLFSRNYLSKRLLRVTGGTGF